MSGKKPRRRKPLTRSEQMARIRSGNTGPEIELRRALWKIGLRYRVRPKLPGVPDIAFISRRIAVFVDGCFWHGCPEHYTTPRTNTVFWSTKVHRNRSRDAEVNSRLHDLGWTVLRFWEHDVADRLNSVVDTIRQAVAGSQRQ